MANPVEEMPPELLVELAGEVVGLNPGWVIVEGGEPLMRKELFEVLEEMDRLDLYLITNGMLFTERVSRELRRLGVKVIFSMDGVTGEVYESTKSGASFHRLVEAVELASREGLFHGVTVVLSKRNLHQVKGIVRFVSDHGGKFVTFIPLQPSDRGFSDPYYKKYALSPGDHARVLRAIYRGLQDPRVRVFYDEPFLWAFADQEGVEIPDGRSGITISEFKGCACGTSLYIRPDGAILPCMFSPSSSVISKYPEESLRRGWERVRTSPLIKAFKSRRWREPPCSECEYFEMCFGCMARVCKLSENLSGADPACPLGAGVEARRNTVRKNFLHLEAMSFRSTTPP